MLTREQRRVLLFIQDSIDRGVPLTYRFIAAELGYTSVHRIFGHVTNLIERGFLAKERAGNSLRLVVTRRITPIVEYRVWDEASGCLVPFVPHRHRSLKKGFP